MVTICRRFTLGVNSAEDYEILQKKLNEMGLFPIRRNCHHLEINGHDVDRLYLDFVEPEDTMNALIEYLKTEYKGRARITY